MKCVEVTKAAEHANATNNNKKPHVCSYVLENNGISLSLLPSGAALLFFWQRFIANVRHTAVTTTHFSGSLVGLSGTG